MDDVLSSTATASRPSLRGRSARGGGHGRADARKSGMKTAMFSILRRASTSRPQRNLQGRAALPPRAYRAGRTTRGGRIRVGDDTPNREGARGRSSTTFNTRSENDTDRTAFVRVLFVDVLCRPLPFHEAADQRGDRQSDRLRTRSCRRQRTRRLGKASSAPRVKAQRQRRAYGASRLKSLLHPGPAGLRPRAVSTMCRDGF